MPKLKEKTSEKQNDQLRALVAYKKELYGIDHDELALKVRLDPKTLRTHLKEPDLFRAKNLRLLFDTLNFTPEERGSVM